jgi:phenylacetate-CoA ligase
MMEDRALTDDERFPLIDATGRAHLAALRQHPHAPLYNIQCGDRLTEEGLQQVRKFEQEVLSQEPAWQAGQPPEWVLRFAERLLRTVPFYRRRGGSASSFSSLPTVNRSDVQREPWSFVPDDQPLDDLVNYWTSGTSGHSMDVLSHPACSSKRLPIFRKALARHGVTLDGGAGRTAILFVCSQARTFTYASVSAYLGGAAHVKVNLNPKEWRAGGDREAFIDDLEPEILTGDPLSFLDLASTAVTIRPKAMISTAMALLPRLREKLEQRFGCPVIDIYSTCETGPIALAGGERFEMFLPDVYVEILRAGGTVASPGERGEITFTGGRNPFLPMLRYRTGDFGAMAYDGPAPALTQFEGRPPVVFRATDGRLINNLDITVAMRRFALTQFTMHQNADATIIFQRSGAEHSAAELEAAMRELFGADQKLVLEMLPDDGVKRIPYSTELAKREL